MLFLLCRCLLLVLLLLLLLRLLLRYHHHKQCNNRERVLLVVWTSKQRTNTQNHTYVVLVYVLSVHRFHTKQYAVVFPTGVQFWLYKIRQKILLVEIRFIICTYVQDISNSIYQDSCQQQKSRKVEQCNNKYQKIFCCLLSYDHTFSSAYAHHTTPHHTTPHTI